MADITVLMPVHNAGGYLQPAIDSILGQELTDFELLIVDDGSDDGSIAVLARQVDPRIRVVLRERAGLGSALNHGIALCRTPYLARMDADDLSAPTRLGRQRDLLDRRPEVGAVGTQFDYFSDRHQLPSPALPLEHGRIEAELLAGNLAVVHASLMVRTELLKRIGGYRVAGIGEDWDLFLRLAESTTLANLPDRLYEWRIHEGNINLAKTRAEQRGIAFARYCAGQRTRRLPEPDVQAFGARQVPSWTRAASLCRALSLVQYRRGLLSLGRGESIRGGLHMAAAGLMAPGRGLRRMRQFSRHYLFPTRRIVPVANREESRCASRT